jgi:hypothetical protein
MSEVAKCLWYCLRIFYWCGLWGRHQWVIITDSHVVGGQSVPYKHERKCARCGETPPVAPDTWYSCIGGVWVEHRADESRQ